MLHVKQSPAFSVSCFAPYLLKPDDFLACFGGGLGMSRKLQVVSRLCERFSELKNITEFTGVLLGSVDICVERWDLSCCMSTLSLPSGDGSWATETTRGNSESNELYPVSEQIMQLSGKTSCGQTSVTTFLYLVCRSSLPFPEPESYEVCIYLYYPV